MIQNLHFDLSPEQIKTLSDSAFQTLEMRLDQIAKSPQKEAVFEIEWALAHFSNALGVPLFLKYVSSDAAVRKAADEVETRVQKFLVDIFTREDLYESVLFSQKHLTGLSEAQTELLNDTLFHFTKNGLGLDLSLRKVFIETKKRLIECEAEFSKNLLEENTVLDFSKAELQGLSEDFINSLQKTEEGKLQVTLSYPHVTAVMENARSSEARKRLSFYFNTRGGKRNRQLLEEATQLRHQIAQMLGFKNHAELVLSKRMAGSPDKVKTFLVDLLNRLSPFGKTERAELLKFKKDFLSDESPLTSYEWRYLHNQLLKKKYDFDPRIVQEYFPATKVISGMLDIYQTLLGVIFKKDPNAPTWHPSVEKFEVWQGEKLISHFYMDLFPREGKYGHAAAFTLVTAFEVPQEGYQNPFSAIVANFSAATKDKPSLLTHSEVETLFHEFGHIMHQILTRAKWPSYSGTGVKTDFVEAPSQMFENWVWQKDILKKLSSHYLRPNESLPDGLIEKMIASKNFNSGLHYLRQLTFGFFDLDLHTHEKVDSSESYENRMKEVFGIPILEGTFPQSSFGHLMGGYDAGYYGYLWAEVFAQDLFTRFEKEGLLNPQTGKSYREWILEPGGEKPPLELMKGFLGREPNAEAFTKSLV